MEVACSQCLGCRLDHSRMWAVRIMHEAGLHEFDRGNCFVTLTYRDRWQCTDAQLADGLHIPDDWSLVKKHHQDFMKRLRYKLGGNIRFFHVGEYGSRCRHGHHVDACYCANVGRPHYHTILFNCSFDDRELVSERDGIKLYTSKQLEDIWSYGLVSLGEVTLESAAYVARYCLKKVNGDLAYYHYQAISDDGEISQLLPEYTTMSRGGRNGRGIAYDWFKKYSEDCFPSDEVPVPGKGVLKKVPRYYEQLFGEENESDLEEVKAARQIFRAENAEEYTPERLMAKYKVKKAQVDLLKRDAL